jgi:hypothetical protein
MLTDREHTRAEDAGAAKVEDLRCSIDELVRERQELRVDRAGMDVLERNRISIGRLQRELADALIARNLAPAAADAPA